jgi:carbonic anhydrase
MEITCKTQQLIKGYKLFKKRYSNGSNQLYEHLVTYGQNPKFLVIACSDSRVDPALLTNAAPGDLFVVRNVANLVPPYEADGGYHGTSAALEFGIRGLGIQNILILGHTQCGGITSILEQNSPTDTQFINKWMQIATTALEKTKSKHSLDNKEDQIDSCGRYSMLKSRDNLLTFPWIAELYNSGALKIHLWNFNIKSCHLEIYDETKDAFINVGD